MMRRALCCYRVRVCGCLSLYPRVFLPALEPGYRCRKPPRRARGMMCCALCYAHTIVYPYAHVFLCALEPPGIVWVKVSDCRSRGAKLSGHVLKPTCLPFSEMRFPGIHTCGHIHTHTKQNVTDPVSHRPAPPRPHLLSYYIPVLTHAHANQALLLYARNACRNGLGTVVWSQRRLLIKIA